MSSHGTVLDGEAAALFSALADPTRLQVVQLLGQRPLRAGELAAAAGMSAPAMSATCGCCCGPA